MMTMCKRFESAMADLMILMYTKSTRGLEPQTLRFCLKFLALLTLKFEYIEETMYK